MPPKPMQQIVLRLSLEDYAALKALADARLTTISQLLRDGIRALSNKSRQQE